MLNRTLVIFFLSFSTAYSQDLGWTISNEGTTSLGINSEIDADGNVYVFGEFSDTIDLDPSANVTEISTSGFSSETYLAKYDQAGNYLWSKKLSWMESAQDVLALDSQGNILIAVNFEDSLIDLNSNVHYSMGGSKDMGILKLDSDGNQLWIKLAETNSHERFYSIRIDNHDNILLNGIFTGALDVDFGPSTEIISPTGYMNEFLLKLDELGEFVWVQTWDDGMKIADMAIDTSRNVWVTGNFNDTIDLDPSSGNFIVQNTTGNEQAFTLKLGSGGTFSWAKTFLSSVLIYSDKIALNGQNEAIIGGRYQGMVQLGPETFNLPNNMNVYLLKMNSNGTTQWARNIQCQGINTILEIEILCNGTILFLGNFFDTTYFMAPTTGLQLIPQNPYDTYCAWYNESGYVKWATRFEGSGSIMLMDLAKDLGDTVVITGGYKGDYDFNLGPLVETEVSQTYYHGFVKKMYFNNLISLNLDDKDEITISYTNPISDKLFYKSDTKIEKVSVFSVDGSMVREIKNPEGEIDFQGIDSGIYLIHFNSGKGAFTARIVHL